MFWFKIPLRLESSLYSKRLHAGLFEEPLYRGICERTLRSLLFTQKEKKIIWALCDYRQARLLLGPSSWHFWVQQLENSFRYGMLTAICDFTEYQGLLYWLKWDWFPLFSLRFVDTRSVPAPWPSLQNFRALSRLVHMYDVTVLRKIGSSFLSRILSGRKFEKADWAAVPLQGSEKKCCTAEQTSLCFLLYNKRNSVDLKENMEVVWATRHYLFFSLHSLTCRA